MGLKTNSEFVDVFFKSHAIALRYLSNVPGSVIWCVNHALDKASSADRISYNALADMS